MIVTMTLDARVGLGAALSMSCESSGEASV